MCNHKPPAQADHPQAGRERLIIPSPVGWVGTGQPDPEHAVVGKLDGKAVLMMGDNPDLPKMPEKPTLIDFFKHRFTDTTVRHLLISAERAMQHGMEEKVILACLLHDISNGCLIRPDHGYWGAQMIAPYVDEEIAWAVKYHQPLRYFADEDAGYKYPDSYDLFFGSDYAPPEYIKRDAEYARSHKYYMTSRLVTIYDYYFFDESPAPDPEIFTDIIGRHFKQPEEGLGFDDSPTSHMWRTMIWPNNAL